MAKQDLSELGFRAGEAGQPAAAAAAPPEEPGRDRRDKRKAGFVAGLPSR